MSAENSNDNTEKRAPVNSLDAIEVPLHGADGGSKANVTLTPGPVSNFPNVPLLKEAVRRQQGRLRRGTASTKTRGEINGSPRKPWRQKGTGRARSGSKKSPIWRGGGTVFGPKPRSYDYGLPKKQRRLATRHALLSKFTDGEARVIESLDFAAPKARQLGAILNKMGVKGACLIGIQSDLPADQARSVVLSARSLRNVKVVRIGDADTLSLLRHTSLVLTQGAFDEVQKREQAVVAKKGASA